MSLFGKKEPLICGVCGSETGTPDSKKHKAADGIICHKCFLKAGYTPGMMCFADSIEALKNTIEARAKAEEDFKNAKEGVKNFTPTRTVGNVLHINDDTRQWYVDDGLHLAYVRNFDDLLESWINVSRNETTSTTSGSGVGRAIAGGVIAGPTGAIVGAVTKKDKTSTTVSEIVTITYRVKDVEMNQTIFDISSGQAENIKREFDKMMGTYDTPVIVQESSSADELRKFKQLLDDGTITQDEFNAKKKQLLGL